MKELKFKQPIWENGKIVRWHYWGYKDGLGSVNSSVAGTFLSGCQISVAGLGGTKGICALD